MRWPRKHEEGQVIRPEDLDWEEAEVHEGRDVKMLWRETLATYSLQVLAPTEDYDSHVHRETEQDKRVLADLPARLEMVEEALEGMLPEGYKVRITEWDK